MQPKDRQRIARRWCSTLALALLLAAPAAAERSNDDEQLARDLESLATQELRTVPPKAQVREAFPSHVERLLDQYVELLGQARRARSLSPEARRELESRIVRVGSQLETELLAIPGVAAGDKKTCVDEKEDCLAKHGKNKGCKLQFAVCLIAKIVPKKSAPPADGLTTPPPVGHPGPLPLQSGPTAGRQRTASGNRTSLAAASSHTLTINAVPPPITVAMKHASCGAGCANHVAADGSSKKVPAIVVYQCPADATVEVLVVATRPLVTGPSGEQKVSKNVDLSISSGELESACQASMGGPWVPRDGHAPLRAVGASVKKSVQVSGRCTGWSQNIIEQKIVEVPLTCHDQG